MKMYGDVPEEHKRLAEDLEEEQRHWDAKAYTNFSNPEYVQIVAKAFTCLAHDWYRIGMDDRGNELLEKAEAVCPGYFKEIMIKQTLQDNDFSYLVKSLTSELALMLLSRLKNGS